MSFHHTALDVSCQLWSAPATPEKKNTDQTPNGSPSLTRSRKKKTKHKWKSVSLKLWDGEQEMSAYIWCFLWRVSEKTSMSQTWLTFAQVLKRISSCYPHSLYTTIIIPHDILLTQLRLVLLQLQTSQRQERDDPHRGFLKATSSIQTTAFVRDSRADGWPYAFWPSSQRGRASAIKALINRSDTLRHREQSSLSERWKGHWPSFCGSQIPRTAVRLVSHYGSH